MEQTPISRFVHALGPLSAKLNFRAQKGKGGFGFWIFFFSSCRSERRGYVLPYLTVIVIGVLQ